MTRRPIDSSQIRSAGHDPATNTLEVEFTPKKDQTEGALYRYANVTAGQWADMRAAESVGRWFGANIRSKPDQHPHERVDNSPPDSVRHE
jgi:hypothetical protein